MSYQTKLLKMTGNLHISSLSQTS